MEAKMIPRAHPFFERMFPFRRFTDGSKVSKVKRLHERSHRVSIQTLHRWKQSEGGTITCSYSRAGSFHSDASQMEAKSRRSLPPQSRFGFPFRRFTDGSKVVEMYGFAMRDEMFPFRRFTDGSKVSGPSKRRRNHFDPVSIQTLHRWKQSGKTILCQTPTVSSFHSDASQMEAKFAFLRVFNSCV